MAENMKKIVNRIEDLTDERAMGYAMANSDFLDYLPEFRAFVRKNLNKDKVFILGCGGSGCEPLYVGFVGYGGLDATCDGQVFTAPSAYSIYQMLQKYCNENGAIVISGNFDGDYMNDDMAIGMMSLEGKEVLSIYVRDDIGSSIDDKTKRGGVAGLFFAIKALGAASELGYTLDDFRKLKYKLENNLFTMTATLDSGSFPGTGAPMGSVNLGEVEFGKGFNGEKGIRSEPMMSADQITDIVLEYIINDMKLQNGEEICVIV
ncbi:MAG: dihydroxyacetone kinase subunit DhaK, partial [Smithella sp.]